MESLHELTREYQKQLEKGGIQKAYRGLMGYILDVKNHFKNKYPEDWVSGSIYPGLMDMTYFSVTPPSLKQRHLKIAVVFLHETFRFEVWLAGSNKQVQTHYWNWFREHSWNRYPLADATRGVDFILAHTLADPPSFQDPGALTQQIEAGTMQFIMDVESFLVEHPV